MSASFHTTRWTLVRDAAAASPEGRAALAELCDAYYAPVVEFLRRDGRGVDDARDLAHGFFEKLLAGENTFAPSRGLVRFRSYLLGAARHFASNQRRDARREKRGAGAEHVAFSPGSDTSPGVDPADSRAEAPDRAFDRAWALAVLDLALSRLNAETEAAAPGRFEVFRPWLTPAGPTVSQGEAALELGMSEGAFKVAIHRLRKRFRELVRDEIGRTLNDDSEIEEELHHLTEALSG